MFTPAYVTFLSPVGILTVAVTVWAKRAPYKYKLQCLDHLAQTSAPSEHAQSAPLHTGGCNKCQPSGGANQRSL